MKPYGGSELEIIGKTGAAIPSFSLPVFWGTWVVCVLHFSLSARPFVPAHPKHQHVCHLGFPWHLWLQFNMSSILQCFVLFRSVCASALSLMVCDLLTLDPTSGAGERDFFVQTWFYRSHLAVPLGSSAKEGDVDEESSPYVSTEWQCVRGIQYILGKKHGSSSWSENFLFNSFNNFLLTFYFLSGLLFWSRL